MTGSPAPLQALERALTGETTQARTEMQSELQRRLQKFARGAGARLARGNDGDHGRRG
jgi:hypothetical protein